jgi:hypothetical protein
VDGDGPRFRVQTTRVSTQWLPDTPSNRHLTVVWCRLLVDEQGKALFTLQDVAAIVGSTNRQAASQHVADFRECGEDMRAFVLRTRTVDATVVEGVFTELLQTPVAGPTELVPRVQAQLSRHDLSAADVESALEQIACVPVLRTLRRQLEAGTVPYPEAHLVRESRESLAPPAGLDASGEVPRVDRGMPRVDPTALVALVTPDMPLERITDTLCWLTCLMTRF